MTALTEDGFYNSNLDDSVDLEKIIEAIKEHDQLCPDHGVGCVCMDEHAGAIRRMLYRVQMNDKNSANFHRILHYVSRMP